MNILPLGKSPGIAPARYPLEPSQPSGKGGFSLVEVMLAIGIVSFAFMALLGLLPVGLNTFRESIDTSVGSQIVQRLINEAQQTDFPKLILSTTPTLRLFDDQGNEVSATEAAGGKDYIYTAEVTVFAPTTLPSSGRSSTESRVSESLATVLVKLANNPGHNPAPFATASKVPYTTHSALIAKNQ